MIAINILILLLLISFPLHNLLSEEGGELRVHFPCRALLQLGSTLEKQQRPELATNVISARNKAQRPSLGCWNVHSASARCSPALLQARGCSHGASKKTRGCL